jgi:cytoskeletal protein CcmA (bactofilin family)
MFGKAASPDGLSETAGRGKPLAASLITANVAVSGDLVSDGEVHLDGTVIGDVRVGRLSLGETGAIEGAIEADSVDIRGRVRGAITARSVRLHASADVEGDVAHAEIAIESGARFVGRSLRLEPVESRALAVVTPAAEFFPLTPAKRG